MKPGLLRQFAETAEMIKIAHSVFALPFALGAAALAFAAEGAFSWRTTLWIVFCAVAARTAAMAQNRLLDRGIDAENPRTRGRALPAGRVTRGFVLGLVLLSVALFVLGAWRLNPLCFLLSPVVMAVHLTYPFAKRFTVLSHLWLGAALGLAPVGAWVAVRGSLAGILTPALMGAGVALWTAGFDLIYACQDAEFDRDRGLFSIPARLGIAGALRLARLCHLLAMGLLAAVPLADPHLRVLYAVGLAAAAALLFYEHSLVRPDDLRRVDVAFFTLNGCVSLLLGGLTVADALL